MPTRHEIAEFQVLLDSASHYIVAHGTGAGLELLPPVWDGGAPRASDPVHHVRIATHDAAGHNRFRTEVELVLAELRARRRTH